MRLRERRKMETHVDLTPLVDVVFLLLLFFMLTTTFDVATSLKLDLPQSGSKAIVHKEKEVVVSIDGGGQLYVGDKPVEDGELRGAVLATSRGDPNLPLVLRADAATPHRRVVFVLDTARELGMGKVGIATIQSGKKNRGE